MATLLYPGLEFVITHQEMIKGIQKGCVKENYVYHDRLVVPIIENTPHERDLEVRDVTGSVWGLGKEYHWVCMRVR